MPGLSASILVFSGTHGNSAKKWRTEVKGVTTQTGRNDGITIAVASSKVTGTALR